MNEIALLDQLNKATDRLTKAEKLIGDARKEVKEANSTTLQAWRLYAEGRREKLQEAGNE